MACDDGMKAKEAMRISYCMHQFDRYNLIYAVIMQVIINFLEQHSTDSSVSYKACNRFMLL